MNRLLDKIKNYEPNISNNIIKQTRFKPKDRDELMIAIEIYYIEDTKKAIKMFGQIGSWDVSHITDMRFLFSSLYLREDISGWDVSNVTNMYGMFKDSVVCTDINKWDVGNVTDMSYMFFNASVYPNKRNIIGDWDTSNVINIGYMFQNSNLNINISKWDMSHVKWYSYAFDNCPMYELNKPYRFRASVLNIPVYLYDIYQYTKNYIKN